MRKVRWLAVLVPVLAAAPAVVAWAGIGQPLTGSGSSINRVQVESSTTPTGVASPGAGDSGWQTLAGSTTSVVVPSQWKTALVLFHFNAIASCSVEPNCSIRVVVDGAEANPAGGDQFWMQNPVASWPLSLDRWVLVAPGRHTVSVQLDANASGCGCAGSASLNLQNWDLTIERSRSS